MKHIAKKCTAILLTMIMLLGMVVPMSVGADDTATEPTYPTYADAIDGDLLYRVNFNGDSYWKPTTKNGSAAVNEVIDDGTQARTATSSSQQGHFGTEVKGLYFDETSKYTITFETSKSTTYKGLIFSCSDITASMYGQSKTNQIGVEIYGTSAAQNIGIRCYDKRHLVYDAAIADVSSCNVSDVTMMSHAVEIDCENRTIKFYQLGLDNEWFKVNEHSYENCSLPTNAEYYENENYKEPLKLLFFQTAHAANHLWKDVEIRKGNIISTSAKDMSENAFQFKTNDDGSKNLRIVSAIDSANYSRIGYEIKINGEAVSAPAMTAVYSSLLATYGGGTSEITLETLGYHAWNIDGVEDGYLTSFVIKEIPSDDTFELSLTPYTDTLDGDPQFGDEVVYIVNVANETVTRK